MALDEEVGLVDAAGGSQLSLRRATILFLRATASQPAEPEQLFR